jgi:hypothetical protein
VNPVQFSNADFPIVFTEEGIIIEVKLEQSKKAASPILVTELPKVTEVILSQPLNA